MTMTKLPLSIATTFQQRCRSAVISFKRRSLTTTTTKILSSKFQGVYPIVVTPFRNDDQESIDLDSFRRSLKFLQQSEGCRGVTITGVLGESNRLVDSEREALIQTARETICSSSDTTDFDLCVGTSYSGTAATVALSQMAQELGATSVMITPSKDGASQPSDDDIFDLYQRVEKACPNTDIVLQDHPSSTGVFMSLELIQTIVTEIRTVRCIKLESLPTVNRIAAFKEKYPDINKHCHILTGLGALYAGYDLESGMTSGFMTGFSFPEILHQMYLYSKNRQYDKVQTLYRKFLPLIVLEQTPGAGLAIRKEIYKLRGLIDCPHVRHPGKNISMTHQTILKAELERCLPGIDLSKPIPRDFLEV